MESPIHQMTQMYPDNNMNVNTTNNELDQRASNKKMKKVKDHFFKGLQLIHFLIVMAYLWAGLVEFINNPPFFDAYGDAISENRLPEGIFQNDPRYTQGGIMRLMDLPILSILLAYVGVCIWLKFEGQAWLLTISLSIAFLCFWVVNFWGQKYFDWRYYPSRMSGMELQVSTLALCGTNILMVLFYNRKRMPFKFKSSLPMRTFGLLHLAYNYCCIFLIMFASMLMWFTKMYISWACFKGHDDLMQLCQITQQVQCYSCSVCSTEGIKKCFKNQTNSRQFSCNVQFPKASEKGAFCIFNYNMSVVEFLTIFAYIGGLCVFLSTFIRLIGHYLLRVIFLIYEHLLRLCNKTSTTLMRHREKMIAARALKEARRMSVDRTVLLSPRELIYPNMERDIEDGRPRSASQQSELSDDNFNDFLDASCG